MAALLERAYSLGCVTARQRSYLYKQMAARGWRTSEPIEVRREQPRMLSDLAQTYEQDLGYSLEEIAKAALVSPDDVARLFRRPAPSKHLSVVR